MLVRIAVIATCLFAAPALAQNASFDCKKASTPIEKAICGSDYTAELDRALDELYRAALAKAGAQRAPTEAAQKQWLATRDARCGRAKVDQNCLEGLYKARIVALARAVRAPDAKGTFISGRYDYRQKGESGEMFLAEMPDGATLVMIDTVNVGHRSPHTCTYNEQVKDRRGDVLSVRDAEASKTCGMEIAVNGPRAVVRETPKDCFEVARHWCGAHGYMLGTYVKR
jgi:uncharacterized protein